MKRENTSFKSLMNAVNNDPSIRGVRHSRVFTEVLRAEQLGIKQWSFLAQVAFYETARRSSAIERVRTVRDKMDSLTTLASITPNIKSDRPREGKFEELEEIEND